VQNILVFNHGKQKILKHIKTQLTQILNDDDQFLS